MKMLSTYNKRLANLRKSMTCDCIILVSKEFNHNLFYFTGFTGNGVLIVFRNKKTIFLTTKLDICNLQNKNVKVVLLEKNLNEILRKTINKKLSIGFDYSTLTMKSFLNIKKTIHPKKTIDVSEILLKLREIKDEYEYELIVKACKEASDILELGIKKIPEFKYEYELKTFLELEVKKRGYELAFETIVANGENSANPHYSSCKDKMKKGFLVIDFGVKIGKYHSDMTRTVYIGKPNAIEIEEYKKVLNVQEKCIELSKTSNTCEEIYQYAKKTLGDSFIHGLGHGVGLEIHELPNLTLGTKETIKNNYCFTIEPGVYYPGKFGIRIEDTVAKIGKNIKILTPFTKKLICIDFEE